MKNTKVNYPVVQGKTNDYYLNSQWIKGEEALTDKQKLNTMKIVEVIDHLQIKNLMI